MCAQKLVISKKRDGGLQQMCELPQMVLSYWDLQRNEKESGKKKLRFFYFTTIDALPTMVMTKK